MNLLSFILIFISTGLVGVHAEEDGIEKIAKGLGDKLAQVLENSTNYTELSNIPKDVTTKTLEEAHIKSDIENLTKLFESRLSIAQKMAEYAENVYAKHITKDNLDESYVYFDAVGGNVSTLIDNLDGFSDGVTFTTSAVQTPTDLYQYSMLNFLS
ncbi:Hypothetical predicted protein [Paramuricea clavata]|uniref:Uncharacterized protein n=1 Tax=Paramuricea clavata TaxID=317549 RepID=A0A6S7JKN1_PARCT|nr:Hypothetical predicted protein [Paramuricea clavata]